MKRYILYSKICAAVLSVLLFASSRSIVLAATRADLVNIYPAIIVPGSNLGFSASGFFLGTPTATYLVTARHVIVDEKNNSLVKTGALVRGRASNSLEEMGFVVELSLDMIRQSSHWKEDHDHDLLVIRLEQDSKPVDGAKVTHRPMSGPAKIPIESSLRVAEVGLGKPAYLSGYRTSLIIKDPFRRGLNEAHVREGKILLKTQNRILFDYLAEHGDSGSPVFTFTAGASNDGVSLIGVHIGRMDCQRNGSMAECSVATPVDYILELIASF